MEAVVSILMVAALLGFAIWRDRDVRLGASCLGARAYLEVKGTDAGATDGLRFRLSRKNYNDLVAERMTPLVLIVLELPLGTPTGWHAPSNTDDAALRLVDLVVRALPDGE